MNKIYFTADLHFGHSNILKHSPKRPFSDTVDIVAHDEWLLDLWKSTVDKRDTVYILGDLTFLKSEKARHLLEKLPGQKFLIEGNHDGSIRAYKNYFKEVYQIKEMRFKPSVAPFLKEDLCVVMCHYPMVTWNQKPRGSVMLHGHSHGKLDEYNALSMDLRFDVGIDGSLANLRFLTLEDIYNAATEKIKQYDCRVCTEQLPKRGEVNKYKWINKKQTIWELIAAFLSNSRKRISGICLKELCPSIIKIGDIMAKAPLQTIITP